jgi:hypothetical protein
MSESTQQPVVRYYFVDEAGDPMLFNRKKKLVVAVRGVRHISYWARST